MKLLYVFCLLLFGFVASSQKILRGVVVDETSKLPVNKATVFINRTSIGTTTNERGEFVLKIPFGRHALIGTAPGFDTYGQFINYNEIKDSIVINLKTRSGLSKKNHEGYNEDGWEKWGNYFISLFLGTPETNQYKIKSTKSLKFQASPLTGDLLVSSDEPLIIENKALGYSIVYKLESFYCNFNTLIVSYNGFSFFQPMNGNASQQQSWERNRSQAYFGSLMHFMRSVYRNEIEKEGFDVRSLKKVLNLPKQTIQNNSNNLHDSKITDTTQLPVLLSARDTIQDQILNPDNYKDIIGLSLPADSIAYAVDKTTAGLYFDNFLLVNYRGKFSIEEKSTDMMSQIVLLNKRPLEIEADGSYYDASDLMMLGYWMSSQKIANMLPYDYNPPKE